MKRIKYISLLVAVLLFSTSCADLTLHAAGESDWSWGDEPTAQPITPQVTPQQQPEEQETPYWKRMWRRHKAKIIAGAAVVAALGIGVVGWRRGWFAGGPQIEDLEKLDKKDRDAFKKGFQKFDREIAEMYEAAGEREYQTYVHFKGDLSDPDAVMNWLNTDETAKSLLEKVQKKLEAAVTSVQDLLKNIDAGDASKSVLKKNIESSVKSHQKRMVEKLFSPGIFSGRTHYIKMSTEERKKLTKGQEIKAQIAIGILHAAVDMFSR